MVSPVQGLSHGSHKIQQSEGCLDLKGRIYSTAEVGSHGQLQGGESPQHMQLLHKAIEHRCQEIDKEMDTLGKFLEKVKTSTGHLTQSCQHEWSDRSLPKEQSQRKRH